jgi:hypothetical protein
MQTTKRELLCAFTMLVHQCGKESGYEVGQWHLECHSPGDGVTRYRVTSLSEDGVETHPMGDECFLGRKEAVIAMRYAVKACEYARTDAALSKTSSASS